MLCIYITILHIIIIIILKGEKGSLKKIFGKSHDNKNNNKSIKCVEGKLEFDAAEKKIKIVTEF